jgi:tRNA modification GTPase
MTQDVDTIAAIATASGMGAVAVIRISGPDAVDMFRRVVPEAQPDLVPRYATMVELRDPESGALLDRAVGTLFAAPASYTGEDVIELSCHGGRLIPQLVLDACLAAGARRAEPGEFTRRAYLRGKLDLVQAEAVADLIEAQSRALHRAALGQLDRGLSEQVSQLREEIVRLEALLVHHIDFPEEDDAPVPVHDIARVADNLTDRMSHLLATAPEGELLREGALTVLAGRPNAGKSSLYNALLGHERAIVTEEAGTTRDAIESVVQIGSFPFRLVDTAGLRESEGRVEQLGIEVAHRYVGNADMVLFCVPADGLLLDEDRAFINGVTAPVVLMRTKSDRCAGVLPECADVDGVLHEIFVSALTGAGLDTVKNVLPSLVYGGLVKAEPEAPVLTRRRHARAMELARDEVVSFGVALRDGLPPEVAATHLRPAETALEEILGVISVEDILDVVFREFCIGK